MTFVSLCIYLEEKLITSASRAVVLIYELAVL